MEIKLYFNKTNKRVHGNAIESKISRMCFYSKSTFHLNVHHMANKIQTHENCSK
jgi:hypothetical protein